MEYLNKKSHIKHIASIPFIYILIVPFVLLDICVEVYHHICFPLYDIPLIKRSKYIVFDRYKLPYLDTLQKTNCTYCAYINGLLRYIMEIGAQTEKYWCAIKHADKKAHYPDHHKDFLPYGDEMTYYSTYNQPARNLQNDVKQG